MPFLIRHAISQALFDLDRGADAYDDTDAYDDGADDDTTGQGRNVGVCMLQLVSALSYLNLFVLAAGKFEGVHSVASIRSKVYLISLQVFGAPGPCGLQAPSVQPNSCAPN